MSLDVVQMVSAFQINGFAMDVKIVQMELMSLNAVSIEGKQTFYFTLNQNYRYIHFTSLIVWFFSR